MSELSRRGSYLYKEQLEVLKKQNRKTKIAGLTELLGLHHHESLVHTFENSLLTVILAQGVYDLAERNNLPYLVKAFEGSIVHDIGKTGVDLNLLNAPDRSSLSPEQRQAIRLHGALGGYILKKVGLGDLAYFSFEHNLGSGKRETWKYKDLRKRHRLTEIVSLADLVSGLLDPRRTHRQAYETDKLVEIVKIKGKQGVYSQNLVKVFVDRVAEKNLYPPYTLEAYEQNHLFMALVKAYGLGEIFEKTIVADMAKRS